MPVDDIWLPRLLLEIRMAEHRQDPATEEYEPFVVIQVAIELVTAEVVGFADEVYGKTHRVDLVIEAPDGGLTSVRGESHVEIPDEGDRLSPAASSR